MLLAWLNLDLISTACGIGRQAQDELTDPERPGGVRDGGFAYAFGDAANQGESASKTRFLRTVGQVEGYLKEQASLLEK